MNRLLSIIGLSVLQFVIDVLYRFADLEVNTIRAILISVTSTLVLFVFNKIKPNLINPTIGGLSILIEALIAAQLVQNSILVSQSVISGIVHVILLAVTYLILNSLCIRCAK